MPDDGLYIFDVSNVTNPGDVLLYDPPNSKFIVASLNDYDVRNATFYVHHMASHSSYEIHSAREDMSLRVTSKGDIELGKKDSDEHTSYRWNFHSTGSSHTYNITNASDSSVKLNGKGVTLSGTNVGFYPIKGPWKLLRLDGQRPFQDKSDETRGKSAEEWCDIAKEVFSEGLKLVEAATESTWLNQSDSYRESYVELFEKFGRKKHVYE